MGERKSGITTKKLSDKNNGHDQDGCTLEDMSIPQPGMPRTIPDLSSDVVQCLLTKGVLKQQCGDREPSKEIEHMEEEIDNTLQNADVEFLGEELAARLCEPKTE